MLNELEEEAVKLSAILLSTENWAKVYSDTPKQHAALVQNNAKLLVLLTKFYRQMAKDAHNFINWDHYNYQVSLDYNVEVIVNDQQIDDWDDNFIKIALTPVTALTVAGAQAGQLNHGVPPTVQSIDAAIQKLSLQHVAGLVGKTVKPDGSIIDNPKAEYNVSNTVRNDIAQSVKTSLALGESTDEATLRIKSVISNPARAERIANTESVNAYQQGLKATANEYGDVGKEWQDAGATDECADNTAAGPILIGDTFPSGDSEPTAHPNCQCGIRYISQQEWDDNGYGG